MEKLNEAVGTLKEYRIAGALLQRQVFARPTGSYEYLTVIPQGDWRTVEYGGERRRLSLRRYIILVFHYTAMGPHKGKR